MNIKFIMFTMDTDLCVCLDLDTCFERGFFALLVNY